MKTANATERCFPLLHHTRMYMVSSGNSHALSTQSLTSRMMSMRLFRHILSFHRTRRVRHIPSRGRGGGVSPPLANIFQNSRGLGGLASAFTCSEAVLRQPRLLDVEVPSQMRAGRRVVVVQRTHQEVESEADLGTRMKHRPPAPMQKVVWLPCPSKALVCPTSYLWGTPELSMGM
eukprot:11168198-Lingulodinium_polyedra.AAC.1